jgi:hypothetical protein
MYVPYFLLSHIRSIYMGEHCDREKKDLEILANAHVFRPHKYEKKKGFWNVVGIYVRMHACMVGCASH